MINQTTMNQLHEMHLSYLAKDIRERIEDKSFMELSFEDQLTMLVDREWHRRKSRRITDLTRDASFCYKNASVTDIDYLPERNLDRRLINELACCGYIANGQNVIVMGATGVGKTYLACALGTAACRERYSARYARIPDLLEELSFAHSDGSYRNIIQPYRKVRLLILDEWLLRPLSADAAKEIFEIMECRSVGRLSTIFCSQFDTTEWLERTCNDLLGESLLDRIVHCSYKIVVSGESMRKRRGLKD
jgi:DNA replication protein DnaC